MKTLQRTFAIIKPDAVKKDHHGEIISLILKNDFNIIGMKMLQITQHQAEGFYAVHRERPFFASLTDFMSSGAAIVMVLETPDAISRTPAATPAATTPIGRLCSASAPRRSGIVEAA